MYTICLQENNTTECAYVSGFDIAKGNVILGNKEDASEFDTPIEANDVLSVLRPIIIEQHPGYQIFIDEM